MKPRLPLQNDLEPILSEAGLSGASIEVLLNLALGPASVKDLGHNTKLLPGENAQTVLEELFDRRLVTRMSGDDRFRLVEPEDLEQRLPGAAGERLAHLAHKTNLEFVPAVNLNPALPGISPHLPGPLAAYREAFSERLPQVEFKPQTICNLNCAYCFIRKNPRDTLSTIDAENELRRSISGGIQRLILTGGESTIRKDVPRLIAQATELGFVDVQLFTNGLMFAYTEVLSACMDAGLTSICLHASTVDRSLYRRLTGRDHLVALQKAMENLAKYPQLEVTLLTVVNRLNLENLAETVGYFRDWQERARFSRFVSQIIFCCIYSNSWDNREEVLLPLEEAAPAVGEIVSRHRDEPWPVMHQGFPYCLLPGLAAYSYDLYFTFARQLLPAGDFDFTALDTMFLKPRQCRRCVHEPYCLGLSRGYARIYGTDVVKPEVRP